MGNGEIRTHTQRSILEIQEKFHEIEDEEGANQLEINHRCLSEIQVSFCCTDFANDEAKFLQNEKTERKVRTEIS